ncbi:response regulator [Solimonas marina]|uniref:Response regulator transcription factor n=1 Tax=Solimonas marina TaxID=2714601 RepID=A0A969W811_9GAMM|nr:response regulator transcription factor [Solimonas marina]NKF21184.1 response regulator transcription factor [Solimonas marina]
MSATVRIALADDQALVRHGLRALLEGLGGIEVAVEAEDGAALLQALQHQRVDVVVSDVRMPGHSGIEVARALRARGDYTPVLLLTTFDEPALMHGARNAGAQGFMLKDAAPEELQHAIAQLAAGATLFAPVSTTKLASVADDATPAHLTAREADVLRLVAGGYSNKEIGRTLGISDGTVRNHLTDIMARLEARDRTHAVMKAIAARLI